MTALEVLCVSSYGHLRVRSIYGIYISWVFHFGYMYIFLLLKPIGSCNLVNWLLKCVLFQSRCLRFPLWSARRAPGFSQTVFPAPRCGPRRCASEKSKMTPELLVLLCAIVSRVLLGFKQKKWQRQRRSVCRIMAIYVFGASMGYTFLESFILVTCMFFSSLNQLALEIL